MYKIKYYNKERVRHDEEGNPIYEIKELQYQCKDTELEYWLNVIKEAYGEHGEITHEHAEDEPTKEELTIQIVNNLTIENKKKDILIASLAEQINNLNIKLTQLGGIENV
ncbi:hypothetical protein 10S11_44 [uncultured Caudovirales phage]|uniref:Uncharacterized protein n=1 Tax=uncultured Caudovirales phage TaxID=2100421 RepID=A0A2H4J755_9CAUD|nr:hypothetical protein 10S11_44 [uncultured Caudovirales phage]